MKFDVFQQLYPRCCGQDSNGQDEFEGRLEIVASINASNAEHALKLAKELPVFKKARGGMRFPIVGKLALQAPALPQSKEEDMSGPRQDWERRCYEQAEAEDRERNSGVEP